MSGPGKIPTERISVVAGRKPPGKQDGKVPKKPRDFFEFVVRNSGKLIDIAVNTPSESRRLCPLGEKPDFKKGGFALKVSKFRGRESYVLFDVSAKTMFSIDDRGEAYASGFNVKKDGDVVDGPNAKGEDYQVADRDGDGKMQGGEGANGATQKWYNGQIAWTKSLLKRIVKSSEKVSPMQCKK